MSTEATKKTQTKLPPQEEKAQNLKMGSNLEHLTFVKLKIPTLIPKELIENVKGRTFTPEQFYKYQEEQIDNPYNYLYVLVDQAKKIHGYLWAEVNILDICKTVPV